jgi:phosphate/sulfate permease
MLTQSSACHASASSVALVFQGAGVADTIRSGITNIEFFTPRPDILAYGACK